MKFLGLGYHLTKVPLVTRFHPWLKPGNTDMRWVPINQDIETPPGTPLPRDLVDLFIAEASHRVVFDECGCRQAFGCRHYPVDIGCLMMGDGALECSTGPGREVGVEEAREHAARAMSQGLVPMIGAARIDAFLFGVKKERNRLLTLCFCCECCCWMRYQRNSSVASLDQVWPRLEGVRVTVNGSCTGCGVCVDSCYIGAMRVEDGIASMSDHCRACGRCATVCPENAVEISIDDPQFLEKTRERIRGYVKYD
ncbi:MAG: 4Fe-4S binding protein [Actinobacteria bacterium]|nr:4Fe-4S binding protein [Actinomycetota bacterium]MBU1944357.1 4Fe-4S binding protein [Actinomycetota bacterium]MBU2688156.1 4Fe-4S binding protein [Actinomycetota bacterium]